MFQLKNVKKIYHSKKSSDTEALRGITLNISNKGLVFVVGESGSGKSTLLNILGGLDDIDAGSVLFNGRDITKFSDEEMDSYRNTSVGFVFQDFNLLETYAVRDNILLALNLQMREDSNNEVDKILKEVGLKDLGNRKINELSGGQKQRVAIARALIKKPKVILADEPTGNLDSKTSKQIFELLKEISKDVLVVVVTHNLEAAKSFGNRIIKLSDGKVIDDDNIEVKISDEDVLYTKSKLLNKDALKLCFANIFKKKFRFVLTVILSMFAVLFMIFTFDVFIFDSNKYKLESLLDNEEYYLNLKKANCITDDGYINCNWERITDVELNSLKEDNLYPSGVIYSLDDTDNPVNFNFGSYQDVINDFYGYRFGTYFVKILDDKVLGNLIGASPKGNQEVVISEVLADEILFRGIYDVDNILYKPNSFEELIQSDKLFKLGNFEVKIVGISLVSNDDILSEMKKSNLVDPKLNYFFSDEEYATNYIYVDTFIDEVKLTYSEDEILKSFLIYNNRFHVINQDYLDKEIVYYDYYGEKFIDKLAYDEIVLSVEHIVFSEPFAIELNKFLKDHPDLSYNDAKIQFIKELVIGNENYKDLTTSYFNTEVDFLEDYKIDKFKIVGISADDKTYFSNELANSISDPSKKIYGLRIFADNNKDLSTIINKYNDIREMGKVGKHFGIEYRYMDSINQIRTFYNIIHNYIAFISVIFILFMVLLIYNFVLATVAASKKEIGILRAMGASKKDVNKIFGYELFLLGFISWAIGIVIFYLLINLINSGHIFHISLDIILVDIKSIVFSCIFTLFISLILSFISIGRVARIKPIDAILDK